MEFATRDEGSKVEMMMTPMIDIVFQLLTFFIMTFKIAALEGDFQVKMPHGRIDGPPTRDEVTVPLRIELTASPQGGLSAIHMNDRDFRNLGELHRYMLALAASDGGPGSVRANPEVELACDYQLRYEEVIGAISAVSGYVAPDGQIVKLVERLNLSPTKGPGG